MSVNNENTLEDLQFRRGVEVRSIWFNFFGAVLAIVIGLTAKSLFIYYMSVFFCANNIFNSYRVNKIDNNITALLKKNDKPSE